MQPLTPCAYRNKCACTRARTHTHTHTHTVGRDGAGGGEPTTSHQAHLIPQAPSSAELNLQGCSWKKKTDPLARPTGSSCSGRVPAPRRSPALDLKSEQCAWLPFRLSGVTVTREALGKTDRGTGVRRQVVKSRLSSFHPTVPLRP